MPFHFDNLWASAAGGASFLSVKVGYPAYALEFVHQKYLNGCRIVKERGTYMKPNRVMLWLVAAYLKQYPNVGCFDLLAPKHRPTQHNTTQHNTTQHNTTQHNTTQHNPTQHNTTQHNITQHNTTQHNTTQHNTPQHNPKQHNATQHNTTQHNTTQHTTTQHNTTQHNTTPQHSTTTQHNIKSSASCVAMGWTKGGGVLFRSVLGLF